MHFYRKAALAISISTLLLNAGCSPFVEDNTVEEIAPITFWSFNKGNDGKIKMSTLVPPVTEEKKSLFNFEVDLLKQGRKNFNLRYFRELKLGQLRMIFINERLAEEEVVSLISTIISDPDVSPRLYLVVAEGNFEDYLKNQAKKEKNLDYNLYRMLRHYERRNQGEMTIVNLHQFMERYYSPYSDPVLPVFKADKKNFTYTGTGLFQDDKLKGKTNKMEDQIFQLIANDYYLRNLPIPSLSLSLGQVRSTVQKNLNQDNSTLTITVHIRARVDEYRGDLSLMDQNEYNKLDHRIEEYLNKHIVDLVQKMQSLKVDPLEIGTEAGHPFTAPLSKDEWLNDWKKIRIKAECHLELKPFSI
ncbi:Ger(x)C family spore germination C-terminal domain-containing protein [Bacillus sp. CECT 9360]|uniref:Ger(x)C family spore germination protein n=1 Tax=Bacillus sp. CECT 9360 TaxID=2845821 RepID=UPI001E3A0775|nr:Ger(x)C family spore germination C-terminal domain-containing protein [Bacillus sp. CECT 9360]CAH0344095.1 hypothetical protein BCI9360_00326 [Bacillus sp. CECT 9360]